MSFDTLAPFYAFIERVRFGGELQSARCACLKCLPAPKSALVLGDGDGRFLQWALKAWPETAFTYVDSSPGMAQRAKQRAGTERVHYVINDVESFLTDSPCYDCVMTHFFLDCFPNKKLATLVPKIAQHLSTDGHWIVTDFVDTGRPWHRFNLWLMYRFFRISTNIEAGALEDIQYHLKKVGLTCDHTDPFLRGFIASSRWRK